MESTRREFIGQAGALTITPAAPGAAIGIVMGSALEDPLPILGEIRIFGGMPWRAIAEEGWIAWERVI